MEYLILTVRESYLTQYAVLIETTEVSEIIHDFEQNMEHENVPYNSTRIDSEVTKVKIVTEEEAKSICGEYGYSAFKAGLTALKQ